MGAEADVKLNFEGDVNTEAQIGGALQALKESDPAVMAASLVASVEREVNAYTGVDDFRVRPPTFDRLKQAMNAKIKGVVIQQATMTQVITHITVETCVGIELTNKGIINLSANMVGRAAADVILASPEWREMVSRHLQKPAPTPAPAPSNKKKPRDPPEAAGLSIDLLGLLGQWQVQVALGVFVLVLILLAVAPRRRRSRVTSRVET